MSSEQRTHPRTVTQEEIIYFSNLQRDYEIERIHYIGTLINISKGGVGMRVNLPHYINEELWFEGLEGISKAQPGLVRWITTDSYLENYEMGIEFFHTTPAD